MRNQAPISERALLVMVSPIIPSDRDLGCPGYVRCYRGTPEALPAQPKKLDAALVADGDLALGELGSGSERPDRLRDRGDPWPDRSLVFAILVGGARAGVIGTKVGAR